MRIEIMADSECLEATCAILTRMPDHDSLGTKLRARMRGPIVLPGDANYASLRLVWNRRIDRRPLLIARCLGLTDVIEVIRFAQERGVAMTIRAGGHSLSGSCVMDDAVMLDLSLMKHVSVDPARRRAVAQPGATWGDFDRQTQVHSLATTGGVRSNSGIAGLTLGGGMGWLMGKHGLVCDNLVSADVIDASGQRLTASAEENSDLFWAIRGGGGNFGVVTAFEYQLHPLTSVYAGVFLYAKQQAFDVLHQYCDLTAKAPDELTAYALLMCSPKNTPFVGVALCHVGPSPENDVAPFRSAASLITDSVDWKLYTEHQTALDFTTPKGLQYHERCVPLTELTDEALRTILHYGETAPTPQTSILLEHIHGNASLIPIQSTAFALRRNPYRLNIVAAWQDPILTDRCVAWTRAFAANMQRFAISDTYGPNHTRLSQLKLIYDSENLFRGNPNIFPQRFTKGTGGTAI